MLALRTVPEFVTTPAGARAVVRAGRGTAGVLLGVAVVLLAAAAATARLLLIRSVSLDQLRETPT